MFHKSRLKIKTIDFKPKPDVEKHVKNYLSLWQSFIGQSGVTFLLNSISKAYGSFILVAARKAERSR